ncbi:hypothetical protein D0T12_32745 [Actinomadura spongiicola]|uniref:Uncharacterized protein n=1 Tax=Actinomadura spongiicola TaxID=2303421 RepID=A0A372G7N6_9ACTN|nr:hypothetical protein [Actinomadura spongiicola]RFS81395.1 hypothetical protein D0T12_32745 [Actinomadura spongiicola]
MSLDEKRWTQKAQELKFTQLDSARRQAEGWRTGLGGLTALLSAVLIVKGRDNITALAPGVRWAVVLLLGLALAMLMTATLLAVRAASGRPGQKILRTGEALRAWTRAEIRRVSRAIRRATWLATLAVACVAMAIGTTWLGPSAKPEPALVDVRYQGGRTCGALTGVDRHTLTLKTAGRTDAIVLATVISVRPVDKCS